MQPYWQKQTVEKPLYPNQLWGRPENKLAAGKLLIVGGSSSGISEVVSAYSETLRAGIGTVKVVMPDATKKVVGTSFEEISFAPSTNSGGFSQPALAELVELSNWASTTLIVGQLGHNSETILLVEKLAEKVNTNLIVTSDSVDSVINSPDNWLNRPGTTLLLSFNQLQKLLIKAKSTKPIASNLPIANFVEVLYDFSLKHSTSLITMYQNNYVLLSSGKVNTTLTVKEDRNWQTALAAHVSVWLAQNPSDPFVAISCALVEVQQK